MPRFRMENPPVVLDQETEQLQKQKDILLQRVAHIDDGDLLLMFGAIVLAITALVLHIVFALTPVALVIACGVYFCIAPGMPDGASDKKKAPLQEEIFRLHEVITERSCVLRAKMSASRDFKKNFKERCLDKRKGGELRRPPSLGAGYRAVVGKKSSAVVLVSITKKLRAEVKC